MTTKKDTNGNTMGTQKKDTKVTTMGTTKKGQQWGKPLRGDGGAAYHNPRWAYGRPGAMQGKPLRGRTAMAHDYTTDTHIASHASTNTRLQTTRHSPPRAFPHTARLPYWDVTCLASLSPPRAIS
jgi:hypothetical protein